MWIAVAGSDQRPGPRAARCATRPPAGREGRLARARSASTPSVDLPGDRQLQEAVDWGKQNLADLTQTATDLKLRFVDEGKELPAADRDDPAASRSSAPAIPDYPWLFATDGEYTAFAAVALGQFETIKAHLLALRDI